MQAVGGLCYKNITKMFKTIDIKRDNYYTCYTNHTFHTRGVRMENPKDQYMWIVKVGEKGQFVIPKEARDVFNINPGDTLIVLGDAEQGMAIPPKGAFQGILNQMFGDNTSPKKDGNQ